MTSNLQNITLFLGKKKKKEASSKIIPWCFESQVNICLLLEGGRETLQRCVGTAALLAWDHLCSFLSGRGLQSRWTELRSPWAAPRWRHLPGGEPGWTQAENRDGPRWRTGMDPREKPPSPGLVDLPTTPVLLVGASLCSPNPIIS